MISLWAKVTPSLTTSWITVKSHGIKSLKTLHNIRKNPETFQQMMLVVLACFRLSRFNTPCQLLAKPYDALNICQTLDFFGWMKLPSELFYHYKAEAIDEHHLLAQCQPLIKNQDNQDLLKTFLKMLDKQDIAFTTEYRFKKYFQHWLKNKQQICLSDQALESIQIKLKHSRLERLENSFFAFADCLCVPVFLQEWAIIDLSKYAIYLGRYKFLHWLPMQSADEWVRRSMCAGFLTRAVLACKDLKQLPTSQIKLRKAAKWRLVASSAEFVFNASILKGVHERYSTIFMLVAKLTGIICSFKQPNNEFF